MCMNAFGKFRNTLDITTYQMDMDLLWKPMESPQLVGIYLVSKKEFLQTPRSVKIIEFFTSHETHAE